MPDPYSFSLGLLTGLGFWWWMFILFEFIFLFVCVHRDWGSAGFFSGIITALVLWWGANLNIFLVIWDHPFYFLAFLFASLPVAYQWSKFKWGRYVDAGKELFDLRIKSKIQEYLTGLRQKGKDLTYWLERKDLKGISDNEIEALIKELETGRVPDALLKDLRYSTRGIIPTWANNKDRIAAWFILWPWSMAWYILSDFIMDIGRKIVTHFRAVYEKIVTDAYKDVDPRFLKDDDDE